MPIPSSGAVSLNDLQTEFGGTNPIAISEYYAGAGLVPAGTTGTNGAVPSSGQISLSQFYGTAAIAYFMATLYSPAGAFPNERAQAAVVDSSGNFYVAMDMNKTGGAPFYVYVAKYSVTGVLQFQRQYTSTSGTGASTVTKMVIDSSNNIYITGSSAVAGSARAWVMKLNTSGDLVWIRVFIGNQQNSVVSPQKLCLDSNGNIYLKVIHVYEIFSPFLKEFITTDDAPLIRITPAGDTSWIRSIATSIYGLYDYDIGYGGSDGSILIGGNWDGGAYYTLWKVNPTGPSRVLSTTVPVSFSGSGNFIETDSSGNIYFYGSNVTQIWKLNSSGVQQWTVRFSGISAYSTLTRMTINSSGGDVYIMTSTSTGDFVQNYGMLKYNTSGTFQWWRRIEFALSGTYKVYSNEQVATTNAYYTTGFYQLAPSSNDQRPLIVKIPADGSKTGTYSIPDTTGLVYSTLGTPSTGATSGTFAADNTPITFSQYTFVVADTVPTVTVSASSLTSSITII